MKGKLVPALVASAAVGSVLLASAASAAPSNHLIHGTCMEDGTYAVSSNVRVTGGTKITAVFYTLPTKGLYFSVYFIDSASFTHAKAIPPGSTKTYTIVKSVAPGTRFLNVFDLYKAGKQASYSFTADEGY